jgi:hypothetical protein
MTSRASFQRLMVTNGSRERCRRHEAPRQLPGVHRRDTRPVPPPSRPPLAADRRLTLQVPCDVKDELGHLPQQVSCHGTGAQQLTEYE